MNDNTDITDTDINPNQDKTALNKLGRPRGGRPKGSFADTTSDDWIAKMREVARETITKKDMKVLIKQAVTDAKKGDKDSRLFIRDLLKLFDNDDADIDSASLTFSIKKLDKPDNKANNKD